MKRKASGTTTVACPVVYGSIAFSLGKKADETATHKWTLFIRGPNDEDLSAFVSKVVFSLHPSFAHPVREVLTNPFEISETGWGEFEAGIRIFFRDPEEQPVDIAHTIKLYHGAAGQLHQPSKQPVMSEVYDEIVFTDPSPEFQRQLMMYTTPSARKITDMTEHYTVFSDQEDLRIFTLIQDHLRSEIESAKTKLLRLEGDIASASQNATVSSLGQVSASVSSIGSATGGAQGGGAAARKRGPNAASGPGGAVGASTAAAKAGRAPVSATDRRRSANKGLPPNPKKGAAKLAATTAPITATTENNISPPP